MNCIDDDCFECSSQVFVDIDVIRCIDKSINRVCSQSGQRAVHRKLTSGVCNRKLDDIWNDRNYSQFETTIITKASKYPLATALKSFKALRSPSRDINDQDQSPQPQPYNLISLAPTPEETLETLACNTRGQTAVRCLDQVQTSTMRPIIEVSVELM
jgi:hypothetical protein